MAKGLLEIQQQFLRNFLSQYKLYSASIPGIGLALKARLAGGGILTASDIRRSAVMCINGIGSSKADALVAWRDRLEMRAKPSMPNSLGVVEAQLIRARIQDRRLQMESELGTIEDNLRECERKVRQEYERIRETLAVEEANIKAETRKNLESVASRSSQAQTSVSDQLRSLMQEISMAAKQSNIEREGIARHLSGAQWELGKLRQQINLPDALTFKRYLVQIFGTN
jgi:DNA-binding helix-hairpin-helix protein with protein kinase domain